MKRATIYCTLEDQRHRLEERLPLAEQRAERLAEEALDYDDETFDTQTPEESARLDRIIALSNRAGDIATNLKERIRLLQEAIVALDDEERVVTDRRAALIKRRHLRSQVKV
jgi:hypothetical protein